MNRLLYSLLLMLAMGVVSCNNVAKQETDNKDKPKKEAPKDTVKETENNMDTVAVAEELLPSDFSKCDMVMLDNGKLFFYNSEQQALMPYEAETDSVVNSVFTNDGYLYYCVPVNGRMMLRCINLDAPDPKPIQIVDWGLDYQSCVTETYGTVSPLSYYADRNMLGLWHEFSWDSYSLNEQKLYNLGTGKITDWNWETWEEEDPSRMSDGQEETEDAKVDLREFLHAEGDNYWFEDGIDQVCLTDNLDLDRYISDPDYASEREFEFVSSSPDNCKVLYMAILEWGDYPHGPLCVSSVDGSYQTVLEDTDCADFKAEWLDDGSLVYVGYEQLETGNEFSKWENSTPCVKRVYPDGSWESFFRGNDFQVRHKITH